MDEPRRVIDLGVLQPWGSRPQVEPPRRGGWRARWRQWWARRRAVALPALLAGVILALVAGAAPAPPVPLSVPLPLAGGGRFEVVGDLLFVAESQTRWVAYDLSTGQPRWSLWRPDGAPVGLVPHGELIMDQLLGHSGLLDPVTGEPVEVPDLTLGGQVQTVPGSQTVLVAFEHDPRDGSFAHRFKGIDPAAGDVRWRVRSEPGVTALVVGDPPVVVAVAADRTVEVRDPESGAVVASRRLPMDTDTSDPWPVAAGPDHLVLGERDTQGRLVLRGFDLDGLADRWRLELPVVMGGWSDQCGPMVCVHTELPGDPVLATDPVYGHRVLAYRTTLVDPATGRVAWVVPPGQQLYPMGEWFLALDREAVPRAVVDPGTGATVRDLTGWRAVLPVLSGTLTLLRPGGPGGTVVSRLDLATLELDQPRTVPGRPDRCQPFDAGLVCRHAARVWVWPL